MITADALEEYAVNRIFWGAMERGGFDTFLNGHADVSKIEAKLEGAERAIRAFTDSTADIVAASGVEDYRIKLRRQTEARDTLLAELTRARSGGLPAKDIEELFSTMRAEDPDANLVVAEDAETVETLAPMISRAVRGSLDSLTVQKGKGKPDPDRVQMVTRRGETL
jgi:hypothetical protein